MSLEMSGSLWRGCGIFDGACSHPVRIVTSRLRASPRPYLRHASLLHKRMVRCIGALVGPSFMVVAALAWWEQLPGGSSIPRVHSEGSHTKCAHNYL